MLWKSGGCTKVYPVMFVGHNFMTNKTQSTLFTITVLVDQHDIVFSNTNNKLIFKF